MLAPVARERSITLNFHRLFGSRARLRTILLEDGFETIDILEEPGDLELFIPAESELES